jgi:hypothetical protein
VKNLYQQLFQIWYLVWCIDELFIRQLRVISAMNGSNQGSFQVCWLLLGIDVQSVTSSALTSQMNRS